MNSLQSLYSRDARWVNWKEVDGRKLPVNPKTGQAAKSNDPKTWGTFTRAIDRSDKIGIMLGRVNKYSREGYYLCGIDLDGCLIGGNLRPEAREIVERFKRYTEISPSGRGVHIIMAVRSADVDRLRKEYNISHRKSFSIGEHQEIALDLSNRYYTVTRDTFNDYDMVDSTPYDDLKWFIEDAGPTFQSKFSRGKKANGSTYTRDESGSGYGRRFFKLCHKEGKTKKESISEIKRDRGRSGEWARRVNERQLDRAWEEAVRSVEQAELNGSTNGSRALVRRASDIVARDPKFVWYPYILEGGMCLVAAEGGTGKGLWACDLVARETRRRKFFATGDRGNGRKVLWFELEDDIDTVLVPRLEGANADMMKVDVYEGLDNLERITREKIMEENIGLIILSPLMAYLDVANPNSMKEMYPALERLLEKVRGLPCTIIGVIHPNKKVELSSIDRIVGSVALPAFVRSVLILRHENTERTVARMIHAKHNNTIKGHDLIFTKSNLRGPDDRTQYLKIKWEQAESDSDVDSAFNHKKAQDVGDEDTETTKKWLQMHLSDGKWHEKTEVIEAGALRNHSASTLSITATRHREEFEFKREGFGKEHKSYWKLRSS